MTQTLGAVVAHARDELTAIAPQPYARVVRAVGLLVEAVGLEVPLGSICQLLTTPEGPGLPAEVVGFDSERAFLMPLGDRTEVRAGMLVARGPFTDGLPDLAALRGRIVDGLCRPLDGGEAPPMTATRRRAKTINPMLRHPIDTPIDVGVGALNALLTIGRGQRVGLFAGSGVGKSVLLGMLARMVEAEVVVIGLIGERGREVQEFVIDNLGDGLARAVVVACPADDPAALRLRGARLATEIAERYRDEGRHVLLLMDSLTRVAQAQREIGLAMGEPPSSKGYTPSAFAALPVLVERAGNGANAQAGSITAFYTVLMEEDDLQDPIVDACRAILDGHVVLSRKLAEQAIYPAVDVSRSVSRVMDRVAPAEQCRLAARFKQLWQLYLDQEDFINIGAYEAGSNAGIDEAIAMFPRLADYVRQGADERVDLAAAVNALEALLSVPAQSPMPASHGGS